MPDFKFYSEEMGFIFFPSAFTTGRSEGFKNFEDLSHFYLANPQVRYTLKNFSVCGASNPLGN